MGKKQLIREQILQKRNQLSVTEIQLFSNQITKQVLILPEFQKANTIFAYMDFKNEVQTRELLLNCFSHGKKVAIPKIENGTMHFYQISTLQDVQSGYFGILEPNTNIILEPMEDDVMLVPGVAFDMTRNRIGYGKGFYDKYLQAYTIRNSIGLAFDVQVLPHIPVDERDKKLSKIVTQTNIII